MWDFLQSEKLRDHLFEIGDTEIVLERQLAVLTDFDSIRQFVRDNHISDNDQVRGKLLQIAAPHNITCPTHHLTFHQLIEHIGQGMIKVQGRNKFLTAKLLKQGYRYHKLRKAFSKFYRRHFELVEKYHVSLKKLMQQGICNPEFYGDLVYKFKKIIGNPNFSNLLKRIVNRFKRAGYSLDIMRQTACLVFNPIMVEGYAALFSCTAVVQASDSMTASM